MQSSKCTWICPSCGLPSFFSSFWSNSVTTDNSFHALSPGESSDNFSTVTSTPNKQATVHLGHQLKVISINVNGLHGKYLVMMHELISSSKADIILCQECQMKMY